MREGAKVFTSLFVREGNEPHSLFVGPSFFTRDPVGMEGKECFPFDSRGEKALRVSYDEV